MDKRKIILLKPWYFDCAKTLNYDSGLIGCIHIRGNKSIMNITIQATIAKYVVSLYVQRILS
jgi:hypothetical protein